MRIETGVQFRPASFTDAAIFAEIESECFPEETRWDTEKFEELLSGPICAWLAYFPMPQLNGGDEVPVAFVLMEFENLSDIDGKVPYISTIDTRKDYRGMGVATQLLKLAEAEAKNRGYDKIALHVNVSNAAQKLYFDCGYRAVDVVDGFYGEDGDALLMVKKL